MVTVALRCLFRGHVEQAAVAGRSVVVSCSRCPRSRSVPLRGVPSLVLPPGTVLMDAHAFAELSMAWRVERALLEARDVD